MPQIEGIGDVTEVLHRPQTEDPRRRPPHAGHPRPDDHDRPNGGDDRRYTWERRGPGIHESRIGDQRQSEPGDHSAQGDAAGGWGYRNQCQDATGRKLPRARGGGEVGRPRICRREEGPIGETCQRDERQRDDDTDATGT